MAEKLTFTEFADLVLARTAEAEKEHGASVFFSIHDLMANLVDHVDEQWPWQAAKHLENEGLVNAAITMGGHAEVVLTPRGRIFVEEKQSKIIRDYRNSPQIVVTIGDGNQVAVGHGQVVMQSGSFSSEEVTELLDEAEERLRASEVPQAHRDDLLADVESAKAQLMKQRPSVAVLKTTVEALRGVNTVADLAEKLDGLIS
jgi:hypothetical protein